MAQPASKELPWLAVANAVNPATGKNDLAGAIRYVIEALHDPERNRLLQLTPSANSSYEVRGRMQGFCLACGIKNAYVADFLLVLQELGIMRFHRKGPLHSYWTVLGQEAAANCVSKKKLADALQNVAQRRVKNKEARKQRKVAKLPVESPPEASVEAEVAEVGSAPTPTGDISQEQALIDHLRSAVDNLETLLADATALAEKRTQERDAAKVQAQEYLDRLCRADAKLAALKQRKDPVQFYAQKLAELKGK